MPFSLCQTYTRESNWLAWRKARGRKKGTFTAANDKILSGSTESTSNNKRALFLPLESPHNVRRLNVDELDLPF